MIITISIIDKIADFDLFVFFITYNKRLQQDIYMQFRIFVQ